MLRAWTRPDNGLECVLLESPDMPPSPCVSVLMPVYNGERFLSEAIGSILRQTERNLELVIVDDGSTDRSPMLLQRWARRDNRIRVLRQPHLGLIEALNTGWMACRSELIARMDSDDVSRPRRIEEQLAVLHRQPEVGVVTCTAALVDENGVIFGETGRWDPQKGLLEFLPRNPVVHGTVLLRRSAVRCPPPYRRAPEDYRLWVELLAEGVKFVHVDQVLYEFRTHGSRFSVWSAVSQLRGILDLQLELLGQLGCPDEIPYPVLAEAWESVAVAAHATGRQALAATAHRKSELYRSLASNPEHSLRQAVQAYGWARLPWHWYHAKALRWFREAPGLDPGRMILLNHPLLAFPSVLRPWKACTAHKRRSGLKQAVGRRAALGALIPCLFHGRRVLVKGPPTPRLLRRIMGAGPSNVVVVIPEDAQSPHILSEVRHAMMLRITTEVPANMHFDVVVEVGPPPRLIEIGGIA